MGLAVFYSPRQEKYRVSLKNVDEGRFKHGALLKPVLGDLRRGLNSLNSDTDFFHFYLCFQNFVYNANVS